jgi:hypothetical protein
MDAPQVSTEDLLAQAQGNSSAFFIITVAYLKDRGLGVGDWATYVGQRFASTWSRDMSARDVAEAFAVNIMSNGATIFGISGDEQQAELHCQWPLRICYGRV